MDDPIRLYLDENVQTAIAEQLSRRGIDVVTVRDLGALGETDENHLQRATQMGRVLCSHDYDYVQMAADGAEHAGIVIGHQDLTTIGDWVRFLDDLHQNETGQQMRNVVKFVIR